MKRPPRDPKGRANQELSIQARGPVWQQCQPGVVGAGPGQRQWAVGGMGDAEAGQEVESQEEEENLGWGAGEGRVTQKERGPRTAWGREVGYFVSRVMVL